jgi:hypothetical protein
VYEYDRKTVFVPNNDLATFMEVVERCDVDDITDDESSPELCNV